MPKSRSRARRRASEAARLAARRGMAPGSTVYLGDAPSDASALSLRIMHYSAEAGLAERVLQSVDEAFPIPEQGVTWLGVQGLHEVGAIERLAKELGIHPLTIEDALDTTTPPKIEYFEGHAYLSLLATRTAGADSPRALQFDHISVLFGDRWVLSLQERPSDVFDLLRSRIRSGAGRVRRMGADYLAHALMDSVVDAYFVVLQRFDEQALDLEEEALTSTAKDAPRRIHHLKMELARLRRVVWPLQTVVTDLLRSESALVRKQTRPFFRDLADHVRQASDIVDAARDRLTAAMDLHLAFESHRMNEVMRMLTIVATIFIPLTFVAGIYGMNFERMPELETRWGYPAVLAVMGAMALGMVAWFRHRRWL